MDSPYPYSVSVATIQTTTGLEMYFDERVSVGDDADYSHPNTEITESMKEVFISGIFNYAYKEKINNLKSEVLKDKSVTNKYQDIDILSASYVENNEGQDQIASLIHEYHDHPNETSEYWQNKLSENKQATVSLSISLVLKDEKEIPSIDNEHVIFDKYKGQMSFPNVSNRNVLVNTKLVSYKGNSIKYKNYSENFKNNVWSHNKDDDIIQNLNS